MEANSRACKMTGLEMNTRNHTHWEMRRWGDGETGKGLVALHTIVLLLHLYYNHYTMTLLGR